MGVWPACPHPVGQETEVEARTEDLPQNHKTLEVCIGGWMRLILVCAKDIKVTVAIISPDMLWDIPLKVIVPLKVLVPLKHCFSA